MFEAHGVLSGGLHTFVLFVIQVFESIPGLTHVLAICLCFRLSLFRLTRKKMYYILSCSYNQTHTDNVEKDTDADADFEK